MVMATTIWGTLATAHGDPSPRWVVLQIGRVQVKPTKLDGQPWDGQAPVKGDNCGMVGWLGALAGGAAAGPAGAPVGKSIATYLCTQGRSPAQQRDPSAPDLLVSVSTGTTKYLTAVAQDTFAEVFDYPLLVPLEGIPPSGLEIQVLDQDDDYGAGELIGMVRLSRRQVEAALAAPSAPLTMSDMQLERIELLVLPYTGNAQPTSTVSFAVNQSPVPIAATLRAGEYATIVASGSYSVAWDGRQVNELGYQDGSKLSSNRSDFRGADHATAIVTIGAPTATHSSLVVGSCVGVVAPTAGQLHVGINDRDVGNNHGAVEFSVTIAAPTLEQWQRGGTAACAQPQNLLRWFRKLTEIVEVDRDHCAAMAGRIRAFVAGTRALVDAMIQRRFLRTVAPDLQSELQTQAVALRGALAACEQDPDVQAALGPLQP